LVSAKPMLHMPPIQSVQPKYKLYIGFVYGKSSPVNDFGPDLAVNSPFPVPKTAGLAPATRNLTIEAIVSKSGLMILL
jgi:hypothetical protein